MHTDEFEISLARELTVCGNTIKRIKESLALMERKHAMTTESFIEKLRAGALSVPPEEVTAWENSHEALKRWQELERQYQETFRMMKISVKK